MQHELPCGIILTIDFNRFEEVITDFGIVVPEVNAWWISEVGGKACTTKVSDWLRKRLDSEYIENELVEIYC